MKSRLKSIATLQSGIYAKPDRDGEVFYLQARHFDANGYFDRTLKPDLRLEGKVGNHLLHPGDVLFVAKGYHNFAVNYQSPMGRAVASSVFTIIRVFRPETVMPEYLTWFLNHPRAQAFFKTESRGSDLPSLNQKSLEEFEVLIPSLPKQRAIVAFHALCKKEKGLRQRLEALRDNRDQQLLLQAIQ